MVSDTVLPTTYGEIWNSGYWEWFLPDSKFNQLVGWTVILVVVLVVIDWIFTYTVDTEPTWMSNL